MKPQFWAENLTETAAACKTAFPADTAQVLKQAALICAQTFVFSDHWEMERTQIPVHFDGVIDWEAVPAGDPEWLFAMNRHTSFVNLGKAYRFTNDAKYAEQFAKLIADWIARVPLTQESNETTWRSLEAGLRCENWLRSLRLFAGSAALTPKLTAQIDACLRVHGNYLVQKNGAFHTLSNWGVLQDHGLFLLGVYFEDAVWKNLAIERLCENLRLQVMRDGTQWEQSPMYHCEVLHCVLDVLTIARQNKIALPNDFVQRIHAMCTALAKWLTPTGRLVCQSDSDDTDARDLVAQGALLFADGTLKAAAGEALFSENLWDFGTAALEEYADITPKTATIASTKLADSGNYMLRSDAGRDAAFLHFHCGCLGSGHGHADLLHVDVSAFGERILIDSGRYTYVNTALRRQLKHPAAHNTTRVDDDDFSVCVNSWGYGKLAQPIKGEAVYTEKADYLSGMHLGYLDKGVLTGRKIVFVKPDIFIMIDEFYAQGSHHYEQNFHFGAGTVIIKENTAQWRGEKAAAQMCFLGNDVIVAQNKAPYSVDYNALCEGDAVKICKKATGFASFCTVISVDKAEKNVDFTAELVPVTSYRLDRVITQEQAQAVRIVKDGREITLIISHGEAVSEVDMLCANGRHGYGKALLFTPENPKGVCLAW
ncbi:MAG: alginate lyase family protein [Ruthenibacterium sp.]